MKLQDHLHCNIVQILKTNDYRKTYQLFYKKKFVDADEKTNGNNVRFTRTNKTVNIKREYDGLLSIYYAKLDGMFWNCRRIKKAIAL